MKWIAIAATALALMASPAGAAAEKSYDGQWQGEGSSDSDACPDFDFWVKVTGTKVHGKAHQTGTDYRVAGILSAKGQFTGTVTYMLFDIAELSGDIGATEGSGQWKALKGPDCEGSFVVRKLG